MDSCYISYGLGIAHTWAGDALKGPASTKRNRLIVLVVIAVLSAISIAAVATRFTSNTASGQTLTDDTVVATLQNGERLYSADLQSALRATRDAPDDLEIAKAAAQALIDTGRDAGESRLVGAALGILRPFLATPDTQTLYLAATARQYQHDFPGALFLLDQAIRLDPNHVNAVLTRATIQIVLGKFDVAEADCQRLSNLAGAELGFLCQATSRLLTADSPMIYEQLGAILTQPDLDASLRGWALGLQGEIAALQGDSVAAQSHLQAVVAADSTALRERLLLADILLADGKAAETVALLEPAIGADGVLIRRVLAARILDDKATVDTVSAELAARFKVNIDLGLTAHAREEALYFLAIAELPELALQRAVINWNLQHEIEDAQLLVDAALLAGQPEAAVPVVRWMAAQAVVVPTFRLPDAVRSAAR